MKKAIIYLLGVSISSFLAEAQTATAPSIGDGSSGNPYNIAILDNLYWITQNSTEWSKYYIQTADIDASSTSGWDSGSGFLPIGSNAASFTGSYDGGGYTISGLSISRSGTDYIGLFGFISDATVKNIRLVNVNISGNTTVGGIVGFSTGSGSALIEYCSVTGTITSVGSFAGGLVGVTQAGSTVRYCYSTAAVSSTSNGNYLGGFIGHNNQSSTVSNCYSRGSVSSGGNQVGGFAGVNQSATISNCYSTGSASGGGGSVGGFVGAVASSAINNSFWDTGASGNATSASGTGKTTTEMQTQSTFTDAGWDFGAVWEIVGTNYPRLQGNSDPTLPVELLSLSIECQSPNVELRWKTATEANNAGWEVQRSEVTIQKSEWNTIGFVEGKGTTNSPHTYRFIDRTVDGKVLYRLKQIDNDGKFSYSQEVEVTIGAAPKVFELVQNYPNPFNPSTTFGFTLEQNGLTTLKIYDIAGREVAALVNNQFLEAGIYYQKQFNARSLASGVYFARLSSGGTSQSKKLILMK